MSNPNNVVSTSHSLAKGLATLALLKANFDSGIDHLDMLLPFVVDCIICHPANDFSAEDIRTSLLNRYGLRIPSTSMQVVLTRATRRNLITRQGGRYFREQLTRSTTPDILKRSTEIQAEHLILAKALINYASQQSLVITTEEDALAMIFEFISQFHVQLLLEPSAEDGGAPILLDQLRGLGSKESKTVARFLLSECLTKPQLETIIRRVLEGYVLQNALLLKDITAARNKFKDLTVYFDTAFLLNALGLAGDAARLASRESLDLLRTTNASLAVFDTTVKEIKRILHVYERHLATQEGIETLRPYPVTRYLVSHHYAPSDVREESALLETHLHALGFQIVPIPDHKPIFTLDEADLTRRLRRPDETDTEPRVVHDVDCIAAVLTIRAGRHPQSYDSAKAVFATTTGLLVKNVKEWFSIQGEAGVFPVIHSLALSSIAWLKKPAAVCNLKLNELIALCSAAIAPSPRTWTLFIKHLRKLRVDNRLTNDELVAVIASELSDNLLSQFDEDVEPDALTLTEIVNRVKSDYQSDAAARIEKVKQEASEEVAATQAEKAKTEGRLRISEQQHRTLVLKLRGRASSLARMFGRIFFFLALTILVIGPIVLGILIRSNGSTLMTFAIYAITAVTWLASVIGLVYGGYVQQWRNSLEIAAEKALRHWFGVAE
jgi:hypothetical protein